MHRLLYLLLFPLLWLIYTAFQSKQVVHQVATVTKPGNPRNQRLQLYGDELLVYAKRKGFNTQFAFLVDMKIPSGRKRFFVYDLSKDSILQSGLVTHGYGANNNQISFSNTAGSYCTSLGKYKIGKAYYGRFGLAYKLFGLDQTNSNAINRYVVLHSHTCVPAHEVAADICMSQGCPTVAPAFLNQLKQYLDKSAKPVLLYIFY
jgi:hypothetical protein